MKKFSAVLAFISLYIVGVYGQQIDIEVGLPIGSNVDNRPAQVGIGLVSDSFGSVAQAHFQYNPSDGSLETVINARVKDIAAQFTPPPGFETDLYGLFGNAEFAYFNSGFFKLQQSGSRWIIPPEVLEVKLDYGGSIGWYIDGVAVVEMEIVTPDGVEHFSSEYGGAGTSACYIGALQNSLKEGATVLLSSYVLPSLQKENGVLPESTLILREKERYRYATFSLLDGSVLDYSSPPPAFLKFPEPKLAILKTADGFELSVTGVWERPFIIESTTDFMAWEPYPTADLTSIVGKNGKKSFRAQGTILGPSRFFRLRLGDSSPAKH